jgi:hypothetical protein
MTPQIDHTNYPKRLRSKSVAELRFIIRDARAAQTAMPDNPKNGYYADEISYAAMELRRREIR